MNDFYIFDHFYDNPDLVRNFALNCEYSMSAPFSWEHNKENILWAGLSTSRLYIEKNIDLKISKLINTYVRVDKDTGHFRMTMEKDKTDYVVHTDGLPVQNKINFAAVVYLSKDADCSNKKGTIFYRHKKIGKKKLETLSDYGATLLDLKHKDAWEIDSIVENKFNRLVLFDRTLFHSAGDFFGTNRENARLVQVLGFYQL